MDQRPKMNKGRVVFRAVVLFLAIFGSAIGVLAVFHPDSPVPNAWHPLRPLAVTDRVTPLTAWKLRQTAANPQACLAALGDAAKVSDVGEKTNSDPNCGIATAVTLTGVGQARMASVQTACSTALRLAMWEQHSLQPLARALLGQDIAEIRHQGSYNCRAIRGGRRYSTHATAEAIDVRGFRLTDGTRTELINDWDDPGPKGQFLRAVRDGSCTWFVTTLSPDYNALHADHFHLQSRGWGSCR